MQSPSHSPLVDPSVETRCRSSNGAAGQLRAIPFYNAASGSLGAPIPLGPVRTASRPTAAVGAASPTKASCTMHLAEFDLPGRLFGTKRVARQIDAPAGTEGPLPSVGVVPPSRSTTGLGSSLQSTGGAAASPDTGGKPLDNAAFFAEVLFMWMGVDRTATVQYRETERRYDMLPGWGSDHQRQVLRNFQECGCLARRIDQSLRRSLVDPSFMQQSLRSAIRRQLTQYHYLLSTVREKVDPPLALGDLVVAYKRVHPKLWAMATLLRETESVKGGEMVSQLQTLIQQGSHRLSSLLSDIYIEAIGPLLHMAVSCITSGDVADPFNEFFIVANPKLDESSDTFWTSKHSLATHMLPTTVPRPVAEDILLVAKNIRFIYGCCRAKMWRMDPAIVEAANQASFATLPGVVRKALTYSNAAVLRLVRDQFKLHDVFRMVSAFLLVGYGDFYELLIHKLDPVLSKLSQAVQVSFVRDQVASALLEVTPYARHLDTDRFGSLHCEVIKDDSKLGWDAFIITMPLPAPLNNLFDLTAAKVYRRLFRMLFKVKVAEVSLKRAWRQSVGLDRVIGGLQQRGSKDMSAWREVAADAHLLGLQLNHFVMNLWSYLVAEVSTVAWDLLMKALHQCQSFDDVRHVHNTYLAYLTQRSLLHNDCASIRMNVENVLTIVREYCGLQALLTSLIERGAGEVIAIKRQYQSLSDDFQREMSALLTTLEVQHLQFDFLNFLLLRLNFNRYYHDAATSANTEF